MEKAVRVGTVEEQDEFRRADCARMTPQERVDALLELQANILRWDLNPKIVRQGTLKMMDFKNVS